MSQVSPPNGDRWVIGITGASGTVYARRLIQVLLENENNITLDVVYSEAALRVLREEEGISTSVSSAKLEQLIGFKSEAINVYNNRDIGAEIASGSVKTKGMVIVPTSMATLAAVANGFGSTLIHRAADVALKEGRKLIVVPRETPLSSIHLENMLRLSKAGAAIVPAMPGFYQAPNSIQDLVDMMVMKITDTMGYDFDLVGRWKSLDKWPLKVEKSSGA